MNTRQVLCFALVAVTLTPAFGGLTHGAAVAEALKAAVSLGKHRDAGASAQAMAANPSAPPTASEPTTLLQGATVDVDIKRVPIVTMSDAPCKNICKDVCKLDFTNKCETVPVKSKVCAPSMKTLTKKVCSQRCSLAVETPQIIRSITAVEPNIPNPSTPSTIAAAAVANPSTPSTIAATAVANPSTPPAVAAAAPATAEAQLPSLDIKKHIKTSFKAASASVGADLSTAASGGSRRSGQSVRAAIATGLLRSLPIPSCNELCQDVQFEVPEIKCTTETREVESCKTVPTKNCDQKCVCVPQKSIAVNLPQQVVDVSFDQQAEASAHADVSGSAAAIAAVDVVGKQP